MSTCAGLWQESCLALWLPGCCILDVVSPCVMHQANNGSTIEARSELSPQKCCGVGSTLGRADV